ncbi:MAG: VWA domain-containing protein, partial [Silanimonas sp.]
MSTRPARLVPTLLATAVLLALSGCQSSSDIAGSAPPPPEEPAVLQERSREQESRRLESVVVTGTRVRSAEANAVADVAYAPAPPPAPPAPSTPLAFAAPSVAAPPADFAALPEPNAERYADVPPNPVQRVAEQPVSTFSIDVDTGSYSNLRRMIGWGQRPPADAVRVEELLNYFDYADEAPAS